MKKLLFFFVIQFLFILLVSVKISHCQILINCGPEITPQEMVENIVGSGIQYTNVSFQGDEISRGIFSSGQTTNLGLGSGIILTSGSGYLIPGPNISSNAGVDLSMPGHPLLNTITTSITEDASVLEFDFIPESDTLRFKYVFGSEDYNENVYDVYNDVFGFFISGPNPMGGSYTNKNIAIVPGTANTSVTINNVNNGYALPNTIPVGPCNNCQYYNDNTFGLTLEYDGFTTVLIAWLLTVPCETYHVVIGVADAGNANNDSGVFIEENSFESPKIEVETDPFPQGVSDNMIEGCVEADIIFKLPSADYAPLTVYFEVTGTANPAAYIPDGGDFEEEIPTSITFEEGTDSALIHIVPVKDGLIEGMEHLVIIVENTLGCTVRYDTLVLPILDYIDMVSSVSPNTLICSGQELDVWVSVFNGFPPYTYSWEPGSFTTDTITVAPEETTMYTVSYHDLCLESNTDSVLISVIPLNILFYSFDTENNSMLNEDVIGSIFEDSISIDIPNGTNLDNLVATYLLSDGASVYVNGELQTSGITPNDFTEPLIYNVVAGGGCNKDWIVNVNLVTRSSEEKANIITVFPNPLKDKMCISGAAGNEITLFNYFGKKLMQKRIFENQIFLDVSMYKPGVYYIQFSNDQQKHVKKLLFTK